MQFQKFSVLLPLLAFSIPSASAQVASMSGTGLQIIGAADITAQFGAENQNLQPTGLFPREVELGVFAPIDTRFDGVILAAAHREDGETFFEVHEVYLGSTKLIPNSRFRLGYFFLGFGRLNQTHRHDWPFITAPKVQSEFMNSSEAAIDSGVEYTYLVPFLPFFLELTGGVTSGYNFGHSHTAGDRPKVPTHYLRAVHYVEMGDLNGLQAGLNYVGRTDSTDRKMTLLGLDLTGKWRDPARLTFLLQSEIWHRNLELPTGISEKAFGAYVFPEYWVTNQIGIGSRFDVYHVDGSGETDLAVVPQLSWRSSEFAVFRAAYQKEITKTGADYESTNDFVQFQAVFILGAHPAHDF